MSEDFEQKYLNQKFANLEQMIENINVLFTEKLNAIHADTSKTNGTVIDHSKRIRVIEQHIDKCPIGELKREQNQMKSEQEKLKTETDSVRYFYRHPKHLRLMMIGSVTVTTISLGITLINLLWL